MQGIYKHVIVPLAVFIALASVVVVLAGLVGQLATEAIGAACVR